MSTSFSVFDQVLDRSEMSSNKWAKYPENVIPMWIADTDFDSPDCIKEALKKRVDEGVFGYTYAPKTLVNAIKQHLQRHYDWSIADHHLVHLPGLVCALHLSVRIFSEEGDGIIVPGPVYFHLTKAPLLSNRDLRSIPMVLQNGRWVPDMVAFEQACAASNSKMILLCNPHNPAGTVYTREELLAMYELAKKYDLVVVSDEIHCDLILDDLPHVPFASLNEDAAQRTVTLMAPSKTFNVAGLGYAFAVIENSKMRQKFEAERAGLVAFPNMLGMVAAQAAFEEGEEWCQELIGYLAANRDFLQEKLSGTPIKMNHLEATYLAWLDVSELGLENPHQFFLDAGVGFSGGDEFSAPDFLRLNFGCPRSVLEEAVKRIEQALKQHQNG